MNKLRDIFEGLRMLAWLLYSLVLDVVKYPFSPK